MEPNKAQSTVRMTAGKYKGINAISNERGVIAALAMDQRGSLKKALASAFAKTPDDAMMSEFKTLVTETLSVYASAILLDPEYGLEAVKHRATHSGVLLAYEQSGYDTTHKGRFPDVMPNWSVQRLVAAGAQGIKVVLYYDPDDDSKINDIKHAFTERIGAECRDSDVPFFLEPISYDDRIGDEKGVAFARVKPAKVQKTMQEFSKPVYGVDILKVEVPVNMRYVEGASANKDAQVVYSRAEAKDHFRAAASAARRPFIYLSAGVTDTVFRETLDLAAEAGTPFSGVLCGRATWQDGIPEYARGGAGALRAWLKGRGKQNIQALNDVLKTAAKPWWDFYGGKDQIQVIER
jgi:tagatose 1,6-diphosphate aldolase